jgi:hypothetical protein
MVTWFLHLMQGDFSRNPTAWLDLIISMFSLAAAPIVKIFDSKKAKIDARNGTAVVILDQEKVTRRTACTVQSSASWQSRPTSSST